MANNIVIPINKTVDISQGTLITTLGLQNTNDQLIQGQSYANVLNVSVTNAGLPVDLSGECMGYFVRQQGGSTVTVAGTISGNVASVEFPPFVYAYTGRLTITLSVGGTDLVQIATTVRLGRTFVIVDPGNVLPNLDEIQQIMLDVESALDQLSGALTASQQATQAANTAAGTANTAAAAANTAAATANTAAAALNGLTATANTLEPTQPATATAQLVDGAWKITIGVPQGIQGIQGVRGITAFQGSAITGTSTTPTAYATGIEAALAGDLYLYTGTDNANIGNVYTCTQGGDASTALWAYATNWRGAPGSGAVSTVNNVQPDQEGNVDLPGQIYPCAAAALEGMSTADLVGIYNQGYRAVQATNNETVVTLGLAADGSLSWQGCNQDRTNLLDNPDFSNPINQRGLTTYSGSFIYSIDRWVISGTISLQSGGISVSPNGFFIQRMEPLINGEDYTLAVYIGNQLFVGTITYDSASSDAQVAVSSSLGTLYIQNIEGNLCQFVVSPVAQLIISMPVLIKGAYTGKTLPPWEEIDSVVNLIRCRDYYRSLSAYGFVGIAVADTTNSVQGVIFGDSMRIYNPSMLGPFVVFTPTASTNISSFQSVSYQGNGFRFVAQTTGGISVGTVGFLVPSPENGAISADM